MNGGDSLYLCHWMRESGLADLLPSLETVWVGLSAGSIEDVRLAGARAKGPGARAKGAGARAKSRYPYAEAILDGREWKAKTTSPVEVDAAFPLQEGRYWLSRRRHFARVSDGNRHCKAETTRSK